MWWNFFKNLRSSLLSVILLSVTATPLWGQSKYQPAFPLTGQADIEIRDLKDDEESQDPTKPSLWPEDDIEANEAYAASELNPTQAESRQKFKKGVTLALGVTRPWQSYSLAASAFYSNEHLFSLSLGGGSRTISGSRNNRSFEQSVQARAFGVSDQWFFTDAVPLNLAFGLGYVSWQGTITPTGASSGQEADANLRSSFDASGIYSWSGLELSWFSKSGFYFSYTLIGMAKSFILTKEYSNDAEDARAVTEDQLEKVFSWGIINLRIGWFF